MFGFASGADGNPGCRWWSTTGAPTGNMGATNDFAVDLAVGTVYQKQSGIWNLLGSIQGPQGAAGANTFGAPNSRSLTFGTAYQATDPTKPAVICGMIETAYSATIAGTQTDTVELRIGPVQSTVADGTGGTPVATFKTSLTGITITIGLGNTTRNQLSAALPIGWYFAFRRVAGTVATIQGAFDQSVG